MKYLITTSNTDKAKITKYFISRFHPKAIIHSLKDAGVGGDISEIGSIVDRATDKAKYYMKKAKEKGLSYDFFIGIDDGFAIPSSEVDTADSYEITDAILEDKYPIGTIILNKRAYACIDSKGNTNTVVTETPFKYMGNENKVEREEGVYPLSLVLGPVDQDATISKLGHENQLTYYLKYASGPLSKLLE